MVKKSGKNKVFLETFDFSPNFHMRINVPAGKAFFNAQETLSLAHWHEEIEIVYCISGRDTFVINGIPVQGKRGQLIVINPGDIHYVSVIDPRTQSDYNLEESAYVTFFISKSYYEQFFIDGVCPRFENIITDSQFLPKVISSVLEYMDGRDEITLLDGQYDYLLINGFLHGLFYVMCARGVAKTDIAEEKTEGKNEIIKQIIEYVDSHYREPLRQEKVAERFYFSAQSFSRFFKAQTGMTYMDYITRKRVRELRKDLIQSNNSLLELALEHGFSDERRCIIAFKKYYGETPVRYRKKILSGEDEEL